MFNNTPASERSVYFDAAQCLPSQPNSEPTMQSSQDIPPPVTHTPYALQDAGPVPESAAPLPLSQKEEAFVKHDTIANTRANGGGYDAEPNHANGHTNTNNFAQHPNGSEGWLPAEDVPTNPPSRKTSPTGFGSHTRHATGGTTFTASSGGGGGGSLGRSTSRRSAHTASDGRLITGSAFVNGAGTTGPFSTAESGDDVAVRTQEANVMLTPKQKSKIAKNEAKNGRKLSKIIKQEAKTEKKSLEIAIKELDNLQQLQKNAVKSEARVQQTHGKLIHNFKKAEAAYLNAKMKYETLQAELNAETETLEILRANAREATQSVQDKSAEVDALRQTLALDDREREVKLGELRGKRTSFWG